MMVYRWIGLILITAGAFTGLMWANSDPTVPIFEIPESITVEGPGLSLGDLGVIQGGTGADFENLKKINLGSAPLPGHIRKITRSCILMILQQYRLDKRITIKMGEEVEIRVTATNIKSSYFEAVINRLLPPQKSGIIKQWVEVYSLPEIWIKKDQNWHLDAAVNGDLPEIGPVLFKVILSVTGANNRVFNISGKIHKTALVYRAIREIPRHAKFSSNDFVMNEMELTNGKELVGEIPEKVRSSKVIRRGETLRGDYYQPVPLVYKDHEVHVIVKGPTIEVIIVGIAKSDGWLGDDIPIINQTSKKLFHAKVSGEEQVEVVLR